MLTPQEDRRLQMCCGLAAWRERFYRALMFRMAQHKFEDFYDLDCR
jgi:hypothetical protein